MDFSTLVSSIREAHEHCAAQASRAVNISLTLRNWLIGAYIHHYELNVHRIARGDSDYPSVLQDRLGADAPACLYATGEVSILRHHLLGLVCSIRCPGSIIIKTLDAVRALRDAGVVVIGGFHSPMEKAS